MDCLIELVPDEVICQYIFGYFNEKDILLVLSLVSKRVNFFCGNKQLWKIVTISRFKKNQIDVMKKCFPEEVYKDEWKYIFRRSLWICKHISVHWEEYFLDEDYYEFDVGKLKKILPNLKEKDFEDEEQLFEIFVTFQQLVPRSFDFGINKEEHYEGEIGNGMRHGFGTSTNVETGDFYHGEFFCDRKHGQGAFEWRGDSDWKGDKYEGCFRNDKIDGEGVYTFANGDRFVGNFAKVRKEGIGSYFFASGGKYVGNWKNDKRNGLGEFTFHKFNEETGTWSKDSVSDSKGLYIWGQTYNGNWKDNEMDGMGTLTMLNGDKYVGGFVSDNISGNGVLYKKNGIFYEGYWEMKKSRGTLMTIDGVEYVAVMDKNGVFQVFKEDENESEGEEEEEEI